jgi:hypothetical protein
MENGNHLKNRVFRAQNYRSTPSRNCPEEAFCFFNPMEVAYGLDTAPCVVVV